MLPPLTWAALAFLVGLVFEEARGMPFSIGLASLSFVVLLWLSLSCIKKSTFFSPLIKKGPAGIAPMVLLFSFLMGVTRMQLSSQPPTPKNPSWYNEKGIVIITGVIGGYPDPRESYQLLTINSKKIAINSNPTEFLPISGKIIIRTGKNISWKYGDEIQMTGNLVTPTDEADFSYKEYLAHHSILSAMYYPDIVLIAHDHGSYLLKWIFAFRQKAIYTLSDIYPAPASALLAGILLGYDNDIPSDVQTAFQKTGTTHIIAISGFNISILAGIFSTIFYRLFGSRKGAVATVVTLLLYVLLTGASPSVIRAAIMGGLGQFAYLIGRRQNGINSLAFVCLIMCLINPFFPWDISFQLSFLSTLGLILLSDPMVDGVKRVLARFFPAHTLDHFAEKVGEYFLFTVAAMLMTFPVMVFHFNTFSSLSFLTNPVILPVQPVVMIMGGISLLLGMVWLPLGKVVSLLAWPFVSYTIRMVVLFAALAGPDNGGIQSGTGYIPVYYAVLFLVFIKNRGSIIRRALQPNLILLLGGSLIVSVWHYGLSLPDGRLHVYVLNNGPSENILIRSPAGRHILLNAGSESGILAKELGDRLPPDARQLDLVFLPVADKQSIRSMQHGISGITIDRLIWLGDPQKYSTSLDLVESISVRTVMSTVDYGKMECSLGSGASLVFYPTEDGGGVFLINWNKFIMLIPVGIHDPDWYGKIPGFPTQMAISVVVLAGNGSIDMNPITFINRVNTLLVIAITDPDNPAMTVPLLDQHGTKLLTDSSGWIHISTDGERLWVETERRPE